MYIVCASWMFVLANKRCKGLGKYKSGWTTSKKRKKKTSLSWRNVNGKLQELQDKWKWLQIRNRLDTDKQTAEDGGARWKWGPIRQKYWIGTSSKPRKRNCEHQGILWIHTPNTYTNICAWLSWSGRRTCIPLGAATTFKDLKDFWG